MATPLALSYSPVWYHIGDPDRVGMAIAYGGVSMALLWVLEALSHRILSSSGNNISLSEAAALIIFQSRSLAQLAWWFFSAVFRKRGPRPHRTVNRRASIGLLLRVLTLVLDSVIIFVLIPHQVSVFENEVGSSEITFAGGTRVIDTNLTANSVGRSCSLHNT